METNPAETESPHEHGGRRPLGLLKHAWLENGGVYGSPKLTLDLCRLGEPCDKHRVARFLKREGPRVQPSTAADRSSAQAVPR